MNFDVLSFIFGKLNCGSNFNDVVSYLLGKAVSAAWKTIRNVAIASFTAVSSPLKEFIVDITPIQSGSGDPSPDNVRPISGWTGANIVRTGENLMAVPMVVLTSSSVWSPTGFFLKAGEYFLAFDISTATSWRLGIKVYDSKGNDVGNDNNYKPISSINLSWNSLRQIWGFGANTTATAYNLSFPEDCQVAFCLWSGDVSASTTLSNVMLNVSNTEQPYAPYVGTTYAVSWQIEAGTVYGGTLTDNSDGTWTLTVTKVKANLSDKTWTLSVYPGVFYATVSDIEIGTPGTVSDVLCTQYQPVLTIANTSEMDSRANASVAVRNTSKAIMVKDTTYSDAATFTSAMSAAGAQIVYSIATPLEYILTAESVRTLLGQNNIFADCGNINIITYRES